ncbi:Rieske [2Fe-2S] iron-sulfur domain-containing protein [Xylariaceae sp. FL0016]|nr:Rieske [2Fe-2S] iron-sulfur domain-containing protein [Xylariaceae sp. FL0016]
MRIIANLVSVPSLSPNEVLALFSVLALLFAAVRHVSRHSSRLFKVGYSSATSGLDAIEKGDTKSRTQLAEDVPFDLEKRAIFLKRWLMVAHESQLRRTGDYRTYVIADIPFILIRGEDGRLRAFHNVCRHRAYTVVRRPCGNTAKLFCRYHGWQYSTRGELLKAPEFANVEGFDKSVNGLFEIRLEIDRRGFIFVNFATTVNDAFPWSDCSLPLSLNLKDAMEWEMEVDVGWRLASLLPWFVDSTNFLSISKGKRCLAHILNYPDPHLEYVDDASFICCLGQRGFLIVSALPLGHKKTIVKNTYVPGRETIGPDNMQLLVEREIRAAVVRLKQNKKANTLLDLKQSAIRERLDKFSRHIDHQKRLERVAGRKINVAMRVTASDAIDEEAEAVCNTLSMLDSRTASGCTIEKGGGLDW